MKNGKKWCDFARKVAVVILAMCIALPVFALPVLANEVEISVSPYGTSWYHEDDGGNFRIEIPGGYIGTLENITVPTIVQFIDVEETIMSFSVFMSGENTVRGIARPLTSNEIGWGVADWGPGYTEHSPFGIQVPDDWGGMWTTIFGEVFYLDLARGGIQSVLVPVSVNDVPLGFRFNYLFLSPAMADEFLETGVLIVRGGLGANEFSVEFEVLGLRELILAARGETDEQITPEPITPTAPVTIAGELPSTWAIESVQRATELNLVPINLNNSFTQSTTRAEFAAFAVALYETVTGEEITERASFNDTTDINVQKMAGLEVVTGVGDGNFNPNGTLTREQAAVMLARLANVIGQPLPTSAPTFADNNNISAWAVDSVGQIQAADVMGGVGDNQFAPSGEYTREQSIITMLRLFEILN